MSDLAHVCTVLSYHCEAWTAVGTVALAGVTTCLAVYTYKLFRATVNLERDAKDTAELTHKLERAYVFATVESKLITSDNGTANSTMTAVFFNHGRTPAMIKRIRVSWDLKAEAPQKLQDSQISELKIPDGLVIAAGKDRKESIAFNLPLATWQEISKRNVGLFCIGEIEYQDVLGKARLTSFCWNQFMSNTFQITPNTPLNHWN